MKSITQNLSRSIFVAGVIFTFLQYNFYVFTNSEVIIKVSTQDNYTNSGYSRAIKSFKMTSNSKPRANRQQNKKTQIDE